MAKKIQRGAIRKRDKRRNPRRGRVPAKYDIRVRPDFDPPAKMKAEAKTRIKGLIKAAQSGALTRNEMRRAYGLMNRLACCERGSRCWLSGCPVCQSQARRRIVARIMKLMAREGWPNLAYVTLLNKNWRVSCAKVDDLTPLRIFNTVRRQLKLSGLWQRYAVIGGMDGQFNDRPVATFDGHVHLIIPHRNSKQLAKRLKHLHDEFYEPTHHNSLYRYPMIVKWLDPKKESVEDFFDTISYLKKSYWSWPIPGTKRNRRIPEPYHTYQLLWVDKYFPSELTFMFGCKVVGNRIEKTF